MKIDGIEYCDSCQHNEPTCEDDYGDEAVFVLTGQARKHKGWEPFRQVMCEGHAGIVLDDQEYQGYELRNLECKDL